MVEAKTALQKAESKTLDRDNLIGRETKHWWQGRAARRFFRHRLAMIGLAILLVMMFIAVFAPWISGADPYHGNLRMIRRAPSAEHWLGTDGAGRDVWARLAYASRVSLTVGIVAVTVATTIGLFLGSLAGYCGGKIDSAIMRFTDVILCFPTLLVILSV